eukprot:TRINITY_DN8981_c0_g1_i1.p1 TRINITY_DN8981_c0_g1~~TRINITY_DN8981_c0_g1_i1.p1  ORF type:complete len:509 (+),score=181.76 TRINITY_DN8981_c0_g1_i1:71-1528(+)
MAQLSGVKRAAGSPQPNGKCPRTEAAAGPHPHAVLRELAQENSLAVTAPEFAALLDARDELRECRDCYRLLPRKGAPDRPVAYFCGNSLGLQHKGVSASVQEHIDKWGTQGVGGHFAPPCPWFEIDEVLRDAMATIVGATRDEVVLMNTLTVNLHLLCCAFYRPKGKRTKILIERNPFPSDMYAIRSQIRLRGGDPDADLIEVGPEQEVDRFDMDEVIDVINARGDEIALVMMAGVHFLTGQFFDIERITKAAKAKGCTVGFDLAHAVGNVPLQLHDWGVDFAVWCTYKYLNSGPGNIAGAFVHSDADLDQATRLEGWWGHRREGRFKLKKDFDPSPGAASFQLSNPGVLCLASIAPALQHMAQVGMPALRRKSLLLTGYLELLLALRLPGQVAVLSPSNIHERGCQLSVRVLGELRSTATETEEYECGTNTGNKASILQRQLESRGIVCDNRPPDILRLPPVPLYNSYGDVHELVEAFCSLIVH